uniref:Uncharacterized protein n=1 Tax=Anguilla anguilla TaxID=7936 RepID=A0A0E9S5I7_ANGAN
MKGPRIRKMVCLTKTETKNKN